MTDNEMPEELQEALAHFPFMQKLHDTLMQHPWETESDCLFVCEHVVRCIIDIAEYRKLH
jgi:hypothetical protein